MLFRSVNQSYFLSSECGNTYKGDLVIRGVECMYEFQPGPQVGGADSGCFFPTIIRPQTIDGGTLFRTVKNVDHASHPNFITRALILHPQCNNNTGPVLDLDNIGDMTVVEPNFELHATGIKLTAITSYAKIVRCIGGYFEAGTVDIDTASTSGILMLGTKYDTAKVTGTGAANVAYQQADGWQIVYDAAGATARATVDSAGSLRLMSDPTNARSTSITRIGADGADLLSLTPFLKASNTAADESGSFHEIASNQSVAPKTIRHAVPRVGRGKICERDRIPLDRTGCARPTAGLATLPGARGAGGGPGRAPRGADSCSPPGRARAAGPRPHPGSSATGRGAVATCFESLL